DARPDRGDDAWPPGVRPARRETPAGRHAAEPLRFAGEPVRGWLHRLAVHELRRGEAGPRRPSWGQFGGPDFAVAHRGPEFAARPRWLLRQRADRRHPA